MRTFPKICNVVNVNLILIRNQSHFPSIFVSLVFIMGAWITHKNMTYVTILQIIF